MNKCRGKMWKKRTAQLLANYWQPRMSGIVSDYARDIFEIDWNVAKYDDDYHSPAKTPCFSLRDVGGVRREGFQNKLDICDKMSYN